MALRDSIVDKAGRYGQLGLPYIIAMNALDPVDQDDILDALFGQEQYTLTFSETDRSQPTNAQMSRKPNGVWTSPAGPRYTRVSGLLVATRFSIWDIAQASVRLYHNPWAEKPYSSRLARLSQAIPEGNHLTFFEGGSLASILGLV